MKVGSDRINDYLSLNSKIRSEKNNNSEKKVKEDKVEISNKAKEMKASEMNLDNKMDEKAKKVSGIKKSVENSEYKVDLGILADKILKDFGLLA